MKNKPHVNIGTILNQPVKTTLYAEKLKLKSLKYEQKKAETIKITPENSKMVGDMVSMLYFGMNISHYSADTLVKWGFFPDKATIVIQMNETKKVVESFKTHLKETKPLDYPKYEDELLMIENFTYDFLNHSIENKERIIKFAETLWKKELKNK